MARASHSDVLEQPTHCPYCGQHYDSYDRTWLPQEATYEFECGNGHTWTDADAERADDDHPEDDVVDLTGKR